MSTDERKRTVVWNAARDASLAAPQSKARWIPAGVGPASAFDPQAAIAPANTPRRSDQIIAGRYRLHAQYERGTETEAWLAEHIELARPVVIKFVHATDPSVTERLVQQARVLARIRHPHVAEFSDFGRTETGDPYFVMEQLEGRSLQQLIESEGGMAWPRAVAIVQQVAEALAAGHAQGVVHRDLRPANVLLIPTATGSDFVKLLDFGLASDPDPSHISAAAAGYASPEQAAGSLLDPRSDVYSLGCLLYALVCGEPPFVGPAPHVLWAHMHTPARSLRDRAPRQFIPDELLAILARCLDKMPLRRWPDTRELAVALGQFARLAPVHAAAGAGFVPAPAQVMGFANRPAPRDGHELDQSVRGVPPSRSVPVVRQAPTSAATIIGVALGVAFAVVGGGLGVYFLVQSLLSQVPDREPAQPARSEELRQAAPTPSPAPTPSTQPRAAVQPPMDQAEPAEAAPVPSAPGEATKEAQTKKSKPLPSTSDAPPSESDLAPVEEKSKRPKLEPQNKANDHIGHDELLDPWG